MLTSAMLITCYGFIPVILCAVICVFPFDAFLKTGVCTFIGDTAIYFSGYAVNTLFNLKENYYQVDFSNWNDFTNGNVMLVIILSILFISAIFIGIGIFRISKNKKQKI